MRKVLPAVLASAAMTLLAAPSATQQANPPQPSIKQRGDMIFEALSTRPANVAALKAALTDIGNLQITFRSKPLHRWVDGATLIEGRIYMTPVVGLNRTSGGEPPADWIGKLTAPAKEDFTATELILAPAPPPEARAQRDKILIEADAKIRSGLLEMVAKYPQLARTNWGTLQEALEGKGPPGQIVLWAGHYRDDRTGLRAPVAKEESYNVLVILRPLQWPEPPGQWKLNPMYTHLALMGQTHASAGDPYLDAALKKLLADALAPLEILDDTVAGRRPASRPTSAPTTQTQ